MAGFKFITWDEYKRLAANEANRGKVFLVTSRESVYGRMTIGEITRARFIGRAYDHAVQVIKDEGAER